MNKMKMSAIVLGLAAAGAIAQTAPAAQPAPAAAQPAPAAEAAVAAPVANADSVKAVEEAKKAEEEKAAAEAKKAEEEKAAAEAKKAEETKTAEAAPAAENTNPGEVANAAGNALDALKNSMNEGTSKANMEVKMSGEVTAKAYLNDVFADDKLTHDYYTMFDLNFDVKFNEKWSAFVGVEAFDEHGAGPGVGYNGAWIKYQPADFFSVTLGDLTFVEGAFKSYYGYDDPTYNAAGMKKHDIRGMQITLAGLELGIGLGRGDNDFNGQAYDAHLAYEFNYAGQHLRPYVDYKSYQEAEWNELHAGIDAGLTIGGFTFRAVYGFHADYLGDDDETISVQREAGTKDNNLDVTSTAHTILVEPNFEVSIFQIKTTFFYAFVDAGENGNMEYYNDRNGAEIPEYMFIYAEPAFKFAEFIKLGIPVEYHTNTIDDDYDGATTLDVGGRFYISPVENLDITAVGMLDIPVGDNDGDIGLKLGLETHFKF